MRIMTKRTKATSGPVVREDDLSALRKAAEVVNATQQAHQRAVIKLEALKIEIQERYGLKDGQTIDLTTGNVS